MTTPNKTSQTHHTNITSCFLYWFRQCYADALFGMLGWISNASASHAHYTLRADPLCQVVTHFRAMRPQLKHARVKKCGRQVVTHFRAMRPQLEYGCTELRRGWTGLRHRGVKLGSRWGRRRVVRAWCGRRVDASALSGNTGAHVARTWGGQCLRPLGQAGIWLNWVGVSLG